MNNSSILLKMLKSISYLISPLFNTLTMNDLPDFIEYVWSFYNSDDGLYPIEGITKEMILTVSWLYLQMCCYPSFPHYTWGDGDSLDREHVRDILLKSPQFTFGG